MIMENNTVSNVVSYAKIYVYFQTSRIRVQTFARDATVNSTKYRIFSDI